MSEVEARGELERIVLEKLRDRRWTVLEGRRSGVDLDLSVGFDGVPGTIRFRNAFEASRYTSPEAIESSPTFLRLDLGEPAGEPTRWAVWDRYSFPSGSGTYDALVVHEAIGEGWAAVAVGSVSPRTTWRRRHEAVDALLSRAEALAPSHDEAHRRGRIFETQRENFGAQTQRGREAAGIVVCLVLALGFGFGGVEACSNLATARMETVERSVALICTILMCWLPALILGLLALGMSLRLLLAPRKVTAGMEDLVEMLRRTGAFTTFSRTRRKDRAGLPVVVRATGFLDARAAPLLIGRLAARSSSHAVALEADLCRLAWPEDVSAEARIVPDRWLTVDLTGSETELARLPSGPREERRPGLVRWTFTGAEVDAGQAEHHFRSVAAALATALAATPGPYR